MSLKIIALIGIILVLFSFTKCTTEKNQNSSTFVEASSVDTIHSIEREYKFTRWLNPKEFQNKFSTKYYQKKKIFPAYVEMDTLGNRRVFEIPYEPSFYYSVLTGRLENDFKKLHIQLTVNKGKKLLSLSIVNKDGINLYSGVWVSENVFERESKKLEKYGITPPNFF